MFNEFLQAHPLRTLIAERPACPFPPARDRAAWEGLSAARISALRSLAARYHGAEYPLLTARQFMAFGRTGDRAAYETPYFLRRRKLIAALLEICATGDVGALDDVVDGIWLICEESSWVVSAHNGSAHEGLPPAAERLLPDVTNPYVDLFAAQTAMILALTCALLPDELDGVSPLIRRRVRLETERRVLVPFETRDDFWWMGITRKDLCNWTPWIVSNVMLAACAWADDRLRLCALLERGCRMLDRYLDVLPADGGCDEGPGYWSMAGGALLDCLALLERVTGGRMAFWADEKLRNILRFPLNAWLGGEWFVNFADCDARPQIPGERLEFAGERLGDPALVAFGRRFWGGLAAHIDDTPQLWRLLEDLFRPAKDVSAEILPPEDVWLEDLEVRILRRGGFALAAKGGVNEGSHNHNDCGTFILLADGEPVIVDAGNMTYTGATFSEARYTLWNTRAANHNVPMIGGFEQVNGWSRRAKDVRADADGLALDMADAYPDGAGVLLCRRRIACRADGVTIEDTVRTHAPRPVTEVFLLRRRPIVGAGGLTCGPVRLVPAAAMAVAVEEIPVADPRMARSFPGSLWRATFTAPPAQAHDIAIRIERKHP